MGEEEDNDWEFAGWGSVSYVPLPPPPPLEDESLPAPTDPELLGVFRATSVAGNAVYGSVFYSMPAICSVSLSLSPLSMLVACSILLLWRGILVELGGAVRLNGGNYTYLLNVSGKAMSLLGAAVTLLDVVATGTVSAGTAAAYISGEVTLPFQSYVLGIIILAAFAGLLLGGVKDSTRLTLSICLLHLATMSILIICSFIAWGRNGSAILVANWASSLAQWDGGRGAPRAVFNGICVGFLGVTGVECVPTFIQSINPRVYSSVIRNLLYGAILLNVPLLLLSFALLPSSLILSSTNILSLLASACFPAGSTPWLRYLVVADAAIVLCGGVLCGGVSCCGLLEGLARDGVLPRRIFGKRWQRTGAEWVSVGVYLGLCVLFYATAGFSLTTISNVFSVSFMSVMLMFTVSAFLLHYNLPHLPIFSPFTRTSLPIIITAFLLLSILIVGNVVLSPILLLLVFLYLTAIFGALWIGQQWSKVMRFTIWTLDQMDVAAGRWMGGLLPRVMFGGGRRRGATVRSRLRDWMVRNMRRAKRDAVCAWVKDDEISSLIQIVLYVLANEQTSRLVLIHAYESVENIPSELHANAKLLDEAFPALTVDLKFVQGEFSPSIVQSVADQLEIPPSFHLMGCPLPIHGELGGFGGVRVMRG
ncbi:amino acid permease-domain-containing protein [Mrakia frigida]|uniref:APC family permease n=1 Tax=Mrakia frigida TaxID=29902 RepID=UPI003FCBFB9E